MSFHFVLYSNINSFVLLYQGDYLMCPLTVGFYKGYSGGGLYFPDSNSPATGFYPLREIKRDPVRLCIRVERSKIHLSLLGIIATYIWVPKPEIIEIYFESKLIPLHMVEDLLKLRDMGFVVEVGPL